MIRRDHKTSAIIAAVVIASSILQVLACNAMFHRGYREGQLDALEGRFHYLIIDGKTVEVKGETR